MTHTTTREVVIYCRNTRQYLTVPKGITIEELYPMTGLDLPHGPLCARVNNKVEGLHYTIYEAQDIEFVDITSAAGLRTYTRSLNFVLSKAVQDTYPGATLRISTPISGGYYCTVRQDGHSITPDVERLRGRMQQIIDEDLPYCRIMAHTSDAVALFRSQGLEDKALLLEGISRLYTCYYSLGDTTDYYYGALLVRTSQLYLYGLEPYADGCLLRVPDSGQPDRLRPMRSQPKLFEVFDEQHHWQDILGVSTVGELNAACRQGHTNALINVSEALQEKRIARIADSIAANPALRVVLIAGPSSSGKTTFSKRLSVQLMASGKRPYAISLDDYFVDRTRTPRDADGNYDYECIGAMDVERFNQDMQALLRGDEVELPRYDFQSGKSMPSGTRLRLQPDMILILEGIHALNPVFSAGIQADAKYKIFASALTTLMLDDHNYIPTTDNRLLRRIVRDYKYRGCSAADTIARWPSVRAGEEKWIFPFQEEADVMVNTALLFELAALRQQALPLLEQVPETAPEYSEAYRLRKFLSYISPIGIEGLPPTSLLREFMGGSTFVY